MNENFLQYTWKFQLFDHRDLKTTSGEPITILYPGIQNFDSGPDFFNAKIKIGSTTWAGNLEIHLKSSQWRAHNHHLDKAYNNVILHVVLNHDGETKFNGIEFPTLELNKRIDYSLIKKYNNLMESRDWVPCQNQLKDVPHIIMSNWQNRILIERLQRKSGQIVDRLKLNNNSWEETFYQFMAKNFGFYINSLPFDLLASSIPMKCLARHKNNLQQIEALLFGQAGFLNTNFRDEYPKQLKSAYQHLSHKFRLKPIDNYLWKFFRLRPVNFPTIRIAQFASLLHSSSNLFSKVLDNGDLTMIRQMFMVKTSPYWLNHFHFDQSSGEQSKNIGINSIDNILINTIVPFLFAYGNKIDRADYLERALSFMEKIRAEPNTIIKKWAKLEVNAISAYQSQALLELKNMYCFHKKCLNCAIGNSILKGKKNDQ